MIPLDHASIAANRYASPLYLFDVDVVQAFHLLYIIADFFYAVLGEPSYLLIHALYQWFFARDFPKLGIWPPFAALRSSHVVIIQPTAFCSSTRRVLTSGTFSNVFLRHFRRTRTMPILCYQPFHCLPSCLPTVLRTWYLDPILYCSIVFCGPEFHDAHIYGKLSAAYSHFCHPCSCFFTFSAFSPTA